MGIIAENWTEVLPRYGLYSTYTIIFGGILLISGFGPDFQKKGRNFYAPPVNDDFFNPKRSKREDFQPRIADFTDGK
jgi:hypothetical protein